MPAMDSVMFASNHSKPQVHQAPPVVIDAVRLEQLRQNAHPVLAKTNQNSIVQSQLGDHDTSVQLACVDRARGWSNSEFGNEAVRLERLAAHKQQFVDKTLELAKQYDERMKKEQEEKQKAQNKVKEDQNEFTMYLKQAKNHANVAKHEQVARDEKHNREVEQKQADLDYAKFLVGEAEKEKEAKKKIVEDHRAVRKACADHNVEDIKARKDLKQTLQEQKNQELEDAKELQRQHFEREQQRQQELKQKMVETKEIYDKQIQMNKTLKEKQDLLDKAQYLEELETEKAKDELMNYARQKQEEFKQRKIQYQQEKQKEAEVVILEAAAKKEQQLKSMEAGANNKERKQQQLDEWNAHWKQHNEEVVLTQMIQEAEKHARTAAEKMESLKHGRGLIDLAEQHKQDQADQRLKMQQRKIEMAQEIENEKAARLKQKQDELKQHKEEEKQHIQAKMNQFQDEQQKVRDAAEGEDDPKVKAAYQRVVKHMDKQSTSVSWTTDIH